MRFEQPARVIRRACKADGSPDEAHARPGLTPRCDCRTSNGREQGRQRLEQAGPDSSVQGPAAATPQRSSTPALLRRQLTTNIATKHVMWIQWQCQLTMCQIPTLLLDLRRVPAQLLPPAAAAAAGCRGSLSSSRSRVRSANANDRSTAFFHLLCRRAAAACVICGSNSVPPARGAKAGGTVRGPSGYGAGR